MKRMLLLGLLVVLVGCQSVENNLSEENQEIISVDLSAENNIEESNETVEIPLMDGYEFLGKMTEDREVFYKSLDSLFKMQLSSEIIIRRNDEYRTLYSGILSKPSISPNGKKLSFVENVGVDLSGSLWIYNGELSQVNSDEMTALYDKERAIKSSVWLDDDNVFSLVGFYTSNISQGGDVYKINVNTGDMKMIIDSKEGFEIADVLFKNGIISYTTVMWINGNYSEYEYFENSILYNDIESFPIIVDSVENE